MNHPEDPETVLFIVRWYQEILAFVVITTLGWYMKTKGKDAAIVPMSEEEIEHRMTICKQSILLAMNELMKQHEAREIHMDQQREDRLIAHIKELMDKK